MERPMDCSLHSQRSNSNSASICRNESFRFFRKFLKITSGLHNDHQSSTIKTSAGDTREIPLQNKDSAFDVTHDKRCVADELSESAQGNDTRCNLDKWVLGEFPEFTEEMSTKHVKSKRMKRNNSSPVMGHLKKKSPTWTAQSATTLSPKRVAVKDKESDTEKNVLLNLEPEKEVSTHRPRSASPKMQSLKGLDVFSGNAKQNSSEVSPDLPIYNEYTYSSSPRKSLDTSFSEREEYIPHYKLDSINTKEESTTSPQRQIDQTSPIINSTVNTPAYSYDDLQMKSASDECTDCEHFETYAAESNSDKTSNFLSKLSSMWGSRPTSDSTPKANNDTGNNTAEHISSPKDSSVDSLSLESTTIGQGSSVDNDDGSYNDITTVLNNSSNNESSLEVDDTEFSFIPNEAQKLPFVSEIDAILNPTSITFETKTCLYRRHIRPEKDCDERCQDVEADDDIVEDRLMVRLNQSGNNGGDEDDPDGETKKNTAEIDLMKTPITEAARASQSASLPKEVPVPGVISSHAASLNIQQLFAGSGVMWTKVSANEGDVGNIRRAKEQFLNQQAAKKDLEKQIHSKNVPKLPNAPIPCQVTNEQNKIMAEGILTEDDDLIDSGTVCRQ